jgi:DNA mismatch repair protein MutS
VKITPLMKQYWEVKNAHPDKVILFRMGDFYEMFHDDALIAAPVVGLALTKRHPKDETPMCGVPHHSAEGPVNKLLRAGHKVAICEQLEDPALAKGIVKRGVVRILTPGMVYDPNQLPSDEGNYVCALAEGDAVAFTDPSTGESFFYECGATEALSLMKILKPKEFLLTRQFAEANVELAEKLKQIAIISLSEANRSSSEATVNRSSSEATINDNAKPNMFECEETNHSEDVEPNILTNQRTINGEIKTASVREAACGEPFVCGMLREYISGAAGGIVPRIFERRVFQNKNVLGPLAIRHLEIFETYQGERTSSFFWSVDRTKTSVGARQLRRWISFPETDVQVISERLNRVESWTLRSDELKSIRAELSLVGDTERRLGRLFLSNSNSRDLLALAQSLQISTEIFEKYSPTKRNIKPLEELAQKIQSRLKEELPVAVREGGLIKRGVSRELDELIDLTSDHTQLLQNIEKREREDSGISSLKVKYNAVFGYFIEITNTHKDKAPKHYIRKQTLASAERYTTDELIKLEEKILSAKSRRNDLEFEIYNSLKEEAKALTSDIIFLSHWIGEFDVILAFAWLALEQSYVKPVIDQTPQPQVLLLSSRHPVVEQTQKNFIANDVQIKRGDSILLTGPNMAGKSTLMRQVAVSALMMQIGSFVPAREARLPIFTRILTRIGSSDNLSEGLSTFMVEMTETADLIASSDSNSLIVLDEIGRGTATFDGMALAQSILEHLHNSKDATILFATHYHEMASLEQELSGLQNFHMSIRESKGDVKFLYKFTKGAAGKSYGIQVGALAGLPKEVTQRAANILSSFEARARAATLQMDLFEQAQEEAPGAREKLLEEIRELDPNKLTPMSALLKISEWHQKSFT